MHKSLYFIALIWNTAPALCEDQHVILSQAVQELLDFGFQGQRVSSGALETAYDDAVDRVGHENAYLDYAYSIVLRKNFNASESRDRLLAAAQSTDPSVFLAQEELILQRLKKSRYDDALVMLESLSEQVGKVTSDSFQFTDAKRSASWIGEVLAFLEGPLDHELVREKAHDLDTVVVQNLGGLFGGSYQTGRLKTSLRRQELLAEINQTKAEVQEDKEELAAKAKQEEEEVANQQAELQSRVDEFQDVANEEISDVDSKIETLEEQFEASLETEKIMIVTATGLRLQIEELKRELDLNATGVGTVNQPNRRLQRNDRIEQAITIRERELFLLSRDYASLINSRKDLLAIANQMVNKRKQLGSQYNAAGEAARAQKARLARMEAKISKLKDQAFSSLDSDPKVVAQLRTVKSFTSYEKRDLNREKEMLKNSLEIPEH